MARGATHVLGLDIGSETIKAVELRLRGETIALESLPAVIETPENSVVGGRVVDEEAVSEAIADAVREYSFGVKSVVASVGGDSDVVVRIAELPRVEPGELDEAVQWELDRQTPFPVDQVIYDFEAIEHPGIPADSENMEVFLAVAQEDMVDSHAETILGARLNPVAIDVEPLALCRALIEMGDDALRQSTVVVVHIGYSSTLICLFCEGVPVFIRAVPTAGEAITTAIRQQISLSEADAERAKRQFVDMTDIYAYEEEFEGDEFMGEEEDSVFELSASEEDIPAEAASSTDEMATQVDIDASAAHELPPEQEAEEGAEAGAEQPVEAAPEPVSEDVGWAQQQVSEAIIDVLAEIATEVRRSVDHYQRQHRDEQISTVLLSGGSAMIPGIAQFVGAEIGLPAEVADPFKHVEYDPAEVTEAYLRDIGPIASIAVGLAMRDMIE
ncbi:MAG: type IV pilus assembly protein PilM [Armatimonadota bacterium]